MIKNLKNVILCKINNHIFVNAGTCPYTGNNYNICTRCTKTIVVDKTE